MIDASRTQITMRHVYLLSVALTAIAFVSVSSISFSPEFTRDVIVTALLLSVISLALELSITFPLLINGGTSFSTVAYMAMIFMLPFPLPAIAGAAIVFTSDVVQRRSRAALLFNSSNYALTFGVSSLLWHVLSGGNSLLTLPFHIMSLVSIILVIATFYFVNVFIMNGYLAISNHRTMSYIWFSQDLGFLLPYVSLEVVGVLFALVWEASPIITPLLVVPAVTTYLAFETIQRLQSQTRQAMIAMADAIDARDAYTAEHSHRVAALARRLAEVHRLKDHEIERVEIAARMHDIGKIGIGNESLQKGGPLSDQEWEIMRQHPAIGEQLLSPYRQFRHEAAIVRSHHERWDGKGYPDRIRAHQIPVGARIIAVADTFDAMTSARPYRAALSREIAIEEIRKNAITQFDPQIVATFLQVMEESDKVRPINREQATMLSEDEERPWYSSLP
ncbi:HD-GYP domain-containing protein [soil metagenome]|jgi:hypothetical protein